MNNVDIFSYSFLDASNEEVHMNAFKGKTILIVNTADECEYTNQYAELESFYRNNKDRGFEIIAFPSGNFGHNPGKTEDHLKFCKDSFDISFTIALKSHVNKEPYGAVFQYLKESVKGGQDIEEDFEKFLILKDGSILNFSPDKTILEFEDVIIKDLEK